MEDPQSLNLYAYVENNPLGRKDVDGHRQVCDRETYAKGPNGELIVIAGACHEVADSVQMHQQSIWQTLMAMAHVGVLGAVKTYQTYTKPNAKTGQRYSGRTSGNGTPEQNVAARDQNHHMNEQGYGDAELDQSSTNSAAIRGREQQLIEANGGAQSQGGASGNAINGVSPNNPNAEVYRGASENEFGAFPGSPARALSEEGEPVGPDGMVEPEAIDEFLEIE